MRHTLVHFDRNTYAYVLDRDTGRSAPRRPFRAAELVDRLRLEDRRGRSSIRRRSRRSVVKLEHICPPDIGQKDWEPPSFQPRTGLIYVGMFNICMDLTDHKVSYIPGTPYDGMEMTRSFRRRQGRRLGRVPCLGPGRRHGGVAHPGEVHGHVGRHRDRRRPRVLWNDRRLVPCASTRASGKFCGSRNCRRGIIGQPITYLGPDGHQYVAVASGIGGAAMVQSGRAGLPARGSTTLCLFHRRQGRPGTVDDGGVARSDDEEHAVNTGTAIAAIVAAIARWRGRCWLDRAERGGHPARRSLHNSRLCRPGGGARLVTSPAPQHATQAIDMPQSVWRNSPQSSPKASDCIDAHELCRLPRLRGRGQHGAAAQRQLLALWRRADGRSTRRCTKVGRRGCRRGVARCRRTMLWKITAYVWSLGGGVAPGRGAGRAPGRSSERDRHGAPNPTPPRAATRSKANEARRHLPLRAIALGGCAAVPLRLPRPGSGSGSRRCCSPLALASLAIALA